MSTESIGSHSTDMVVMLLTDHIWDNYPIGDVKPLWT